MNEPDQPEQQRHLPRSAFASPASTTRARRYRPVLRTATRSRLLLLAASGLLARVLASQPVYAYAPPAAAAPTKPTASASPSGPAPQKPGATRAKPTSSSTGPATGSTSTPADTARDAPAVPGDAPSRSSGTAGGGAGKPPEAAGETTGKPVNASPKSRPKDSAKDKPTSTPVGKAGRRGKKAISIEDDFLVEGKLEKPNAYYILRRSKVDFDWARLDARFSPLVLESVQDPLF
jgi:hypothetical protein